MFSIALALFLLMDPIGNVPVFVTVLKDIPLRHHKRIILRELLIALIIIILFHFIGDGLLRFLNVSTPTILISGGLILFIIAIRMIFSNHHDPRSEPIARREPFIVPLATPLIAGPAVLAAVMLYSGQPQTSSGTTIGAIVIAWAVSTLILLSAPLLNKLLGSRGMIACERLMGLILTLLAVQMFLEGAKLFMSS
jgi:multiple antibiotic resistance protein